MRYLDGPRPRIFAHRGASARAPENTLVAFAAALDDGAERLELDVHASRDGHVVVFHDATLERTTDGAGPVRERTLAELRALDAGAGFALPDGARPFRGRGVRVPTLDEVLGAFPGVPLNIEIKQAEPAVETAVLAALDAHGARAQVLLTAEVPEIMARIRAAAPDVLTGFSAAEVAEFVFHGEEPGYRAPGVALQVPEHHGELTIVTPEFLARAHRLGLEVHVWTVDDEGDMARLLDLGVDGLVTNEPARAHALRLRRAQPTG